MCVCVAECAAVLALLNTDVVLVPIYRRVLTTDGQDGEGKMEILKLARDHY
jgi:hypothetical protein